MNVRQGERRQSCCHRLAAQHEAEQAALRLRITALEAALERERESSEALATLVMIKPEPAS